MGKNADIVNKTVSFNVLDPDQNADLEFAMKRTNFSAFCKSLIRMERLRHEGGMLRMVLATEDDTAEEDVADAESIKGFI